MKKNPFKIFLFLFWICALTAVLVCYFRSDLSLSDVQVSIGRFVEQWRFGAPLVYIVVYILRPLVFFPATLLTALSGALFGPAWGILYTIIGENLSANLCFLIGRYFGKNIMERLTEKNKLMFLMDCRFRENGFISVLILRLVYMPFDLVSYLSGMCNLKQTDFALGTFFGILPGLTTFVLLGSSFSDPRNLILTAVSLAVGIVLSTYLKKKAKLAQSKSKP